MSESNSGESAAQVVRQQKRLLWADAAKGFAVIAVVLVHVHSKHFATDDSLAPASIKAAYASFNLALLPIRMPLFFLISGMFAASAVRRSWRELAGRKVAHYYYLYALWLAIQTAVLWQLSDFDTEVADSAVGLLEQATHQPSNLWYLYALAVFYPIAKLGRRWPTSLLAIAAILSVGAVAGIFPQWGNLPALPQNLIWFLVGTYCSDWIRRLSSSSSWRLLGAALIGFLLPTAALAWIGYRQPVIYLAACAAGAALGVLGATMVARIRPALLRPFAHVGNRTLPVYVLQIPLIALWDWSTEMTGADRMLSNTAVSIGYPVVLTATITCAALLLHRLLQPALPVLFDRPRFLKLRNEQRNRGTASG